MAHFAPLIGDGESRLLSCWLMRQSALAERLLWVRLRPCRGAVMFSKAPLTGRMMGLSDGCIAAIRQGNDQEIDYGLVSVRVAFCEPVVGRSLLMPRFLLPA